MTGCGKQVAGSVFGTFLGTLLVGAVILGVIYYVRRKRQIKDAMNKSGMSSLTKVFEIIPLGLSSEIIPSGVIASRSTAEENKNLTFIQNDPGLNPEPFHVELSFFTSNSLARSTGGGSLSMLHLIMRLVLG